METNVLSQLLLDSFKRCERPDQFWHKSEGAWRPISTRSFLHRAAALASALQRLGINKGDRVALLSENRPEWHMADMALMGMGAVSVPLYAGESAQRVRYILEDSGARLCFVSRLEQFEKLRGVWEQLPKLERVVTLFGTAGVDRIVPWTALAREEEGAALLGEFERGAREQQPGDVMTLLYTSGTTGQPKGVMLMQSNLGSNARTTAGLWNYGGEELAMSLLPLCHVFERTTAYSYMVHGLPIAYAEGFDQVVDNMVEIRPTVMAVVPRFFEKFNERLQSTLKAASPIKQRLFHWSLAVGRRALPYRVRYRPLPAGLGLQVRMAEWLVFRKIRARLGGRIRLFISGGAPLSRELNEFFHALGLTIMEGYGLTETSPVICVNLPGANKLGTVGPAIPGVEVRIAEDGEILTRGPHIMKGYYKMEEETAEALRDGWFHTGDLGSLDEDGFLTITGRKKDLIKTAGGKYVAPQAIEHRLKQSPYIANAAVFGDRRKYVVGLVVPNFDTLRQELAQRGFSIPSEREMVASRQVRALLEDEVEKVNMALAQYERLKRFAVLEKDFSFHDGQLTYTQKVRRQVVEQQYAKLIESLYQEEPPPPCPS